MSKRQKLNKAHYVDNARLLQTLIDYKEGCAQAVLDEIEPPPIPEYVGECFIKIAEGLSCKNNFSRYTYLSEMIGDAIENCLMYFRNFNPEKSRNPFSYFTTICVYAFLRRIEKEKKQVGIRERITASTTLFADLTDGDSLGDPQGVRRAQREFEKNTSHKSKPKVRTRKRKPVKKKATLAPILG